MPALIALFCNWGRYSARIISCCAGEWGTSRGKRLSIVCKIQAGKVETDDFPCWKWGLHQSWRGCNANSLRVEIQLVSLWTCTTVTFDNSSKKTTPTKKHTHELKSLESSRSCDRLRHTRIPNRALLFIKEKPADSLHSCLLIRSHVSHKDASIDFGLPGVDN